MFFGGFSVLVDGVEVVLDVRASKMNFVLLFGKLVLDILYRQGGDEFRVDLGALGLEIIDYGELVLIRCFLRAVGVSVLLLGSKNLGSSFRMSSKGMMFKAFLLLSAILSIQFNPVQSNCLTVGSVPCSLLFLVVGVV